MTRRLLTGCDVFDGDALLAGADVLLDGATIRAVGDGIGGAPVDETIDLGGRLLAPGFVDLQVNGGGGVLFNDAPTVDTLRTMVAAHRPFGTTACLPTLISDDAAKMRAAIEAVRAAIAAEVPGIIGIHLEGPHLNPERRGVHDAAKMRALDDAALELLCSLESGHTLVTLAPEQVDGASIRRLSDRGVRVFAGHSQAGCDETLAAIGCGLVGFTHLFNAMSQLTGREPGVVGAALYDPETFAGVIADGHHVHPVALGVALRAKPRGKVFLVTDAMPTVGSQAREFTLYGDRVTATGGRCVTADGTLAGSDIGMSDAVKFIVGSGLADTHEALRMASTYPAHALGVSDRYGYVRPGYRASLVALDGDLNVTHSCIDGEPERCG